MKKILTIIALVFTFALVSQVNAHNNPNIGHFNSSLPVTFPYTVQLDTGSAPWMRTAVIAGIGVWNSAVHNGNTLANWTATTPPSGGHEHVVPGAWHNIIYLGYTGWGGIQFVDSWCCAGQSHWHYEHSHVFFNAFWSGNWSTVFLQNLACHEHGHTMGYGHGTDAALNNDCMNQGLSGTQVFSPQAHVRSTFWDLYNNHTINTATNSFAGLQPNQGVITALASWMYHPKDVQDMMTRASDVVAVVVTDIADGPFLGREDPEHDSTIPTQRITVEVRERFKGDGPDTMRIFQTGGMRLGGDELVLAGAPPYEVGEKLLLYVEPKPDEDGTHVVVAPEGRYLVREDGRVYPMSPTTLGKQVHGLPLADMIAQGRQFAEEE